MFWIASVALLALSADEPLEPLGRVESRTIRETSGIVKSRKYPDLFWILSDSGNPATIHAIRRDGAVINSFQIAAPNVDWEDIATDEVGHLFIAETGNNRLLLPLRAIYQVDEPDPTRPPTTPLPVTKAAYFRFRTDSERFDSEALFVVDGRAILIDKRLDRTGATTWGITLEPAAPLLRPGLPLSLGPLPDFEEPVTGADLSPDGRRLAVVANRRTSVYDRAMDGRLTLRATVRYKVRDLEAIAWDGDDLILASESGELFRIARRTWDRP